jgi:hypothetical protein
MARHDVVRNQRGSLSIPIATSTESTSIPESHYGDGSNSCAGKKKRAEASKSGATKQTDNRGVGRLERLFFGNSRGK